MSIATKDKSSIDCKFQKSTLTNAQLQQFVKNLHSSFYHELFSVRHNQCDGYHTSSALVMHMQNFIRL